MGEVHEVRKGRNTGHRGGVGLGQVGELGGRGGGRTWAAAVEMVMGPLHRASRTDLRALELLKALDPGPTAPTGLSCLPPSASNQCPHSF